MFFRTIFFLFVRRLKKRNLKYRLLLNKVRTTVYVPSSELELFQPLSRRRVCPSPHNRGRGGGQCAQEHSPAGEGLGESQFRRLEKKLSTLPTLWIISTRTALYYIRGMYGVGFGFFHLMLCSTRNSDFHLPIPESGKNLCLHGEGAYTSDTPRDKKLSTSCLILAQHENIFRSLLSILDRLD